MIAIAWHMQIINGIYYLMDYFNVLFYSYFLPQIITRKTLDGK